MQLKPRGAVCGYIFASQKTMPFWSLQSAIKSDACHNSSLSLQAGVFATSHMPMTTILANVKKQRFHNWDNSKFHQNFTKISLAQALQLCEQTCTAVTVAVAVENT